MVTAFFSVLDEGVGSAFGFSLFTGFFCGIFSALILSVATLSSPIVESGRDNFEKPIFSLKNDSGISGNFFLGSGSFNSTKGYTYYTKDDRGGLFLESVPMNSRIFEGFEPTVKWQTIHNKYPWWLYPSWCNKARTTTSITDLYVPTGTVIQEFKVN